MTPEQFYKAMRQIYPENNVYDTESAHSEADTLIVALLTELGYTEGIRLFVEADRWYA